MIKEIGLSKILVSINDMHKRGHSKDMVYVLKSTKFPKRFQIFKDHQKTPDSFLQLALEEILTSEIVLLDAILDDEGTYKDRLIQFGIAFALEKQRYFYYIKENLAREGKIESNYIDQHLIESSGYFNFIDILNEKIDILSTQAQTKPRKPTSIIHEAFSVIGVNESTDADLTKTIREFALEKKWLATFYKPPSGTNIYEELSQQVGARTFSLFCVNKSADISVYIAIGLALGFGVPLLIIIEEEMMMPQILSGYTGVISYVNTNKTDLTKKLSEYSNIFFSPEIFKTWDGFTYFYLLSKIEKRLSETTSKSDIEEIEQIILAITKVGRAPIIRAYVLLGDTFRRKTQVIDKLNTDYLRQAIFWYEKALNLQPDNQRCIDGMDATRKLIQLIDLIINKNFGSIPELIYLTGTNINLEQYQFLKSFLLDEVKKLIANKEFLHAIALLAAMQKHDMSEDLKKLWESINPQNFLESIQTYQENELRTRAELEVALEKNKEIFNQLGNAYTEVHNANQIKNKLDQTTGFYGQTIFVNFGIGWATYMPLKGLPYVKRNGQKIFVTEGMSTENGDTLYDGDNVQQFHWLSDYENSILEAYKKLDS